MSLDQFDNWFEDNTLDAHTDAQVCEVYEAFEAALARYYFDGTGETALKTELARAVHAFERRGDSIRWQQSDEEHEWSSCDTRSSATRSPGQLAERVLV